MALFGNAAAGRRPMQGQEQGPQQQYRLPSFGMGQGQGQGQVRPFFGQGLAPSMGMLGQQMGMQRPAPQMGMQRPPFNPQQLQAAGQDMSWMNKQYPQVQMQGQTPWQQYFNPSQQLPSSGNTGIAGGGMGPSAGALQDYLQRARTSGAQLM